MKCAWLALACLIVAADARAQPQSILAGTVMDADGAAIAGAGLTLEGTSLPAGKLTTQTTVEGRYRFQGLPAGVYVLTASRQGMQTVRRSGLLIAVGATSLVDVVLQRGESTDVVTVGDAGPIVDVTSALSVTRLSEQDLARLPIDRGAAILQLVPGVAPRTAFGSGLDSSRVTVDGGPATVTLRSSGAESAAIHPYWMAETQVVGPGATAEYGEFGGVVANIALKSGTNWFSGLLEYQMTPSGWVGDNTGELELSLQETFQPQQILERWSGHLQSGGPVLRDRLFFFAGIDYAKNKVVQAGTLGNVPLDQWSPVSLGKLSWAPRRDLRLQGFFEADWNREVGTLGRNALPETANDRSSRMLSGNGTAVWSAGSQSLLELRAGGVDFTFRGIPEARRAGPAPRRDRKTSIRSGNVQRFQDQDGTRYVGGGTFTHVLDRFGAHTFKTGIEIERTRYRNWSATPGGQSWTDFNGAPEMFVSWSGDEVSGTGTRTTVFVQDAWSMAGRLTIHPGLRVSWNRGSVPDHGVVFRTTPVSPRLGIAWDVSADHRTVVRANYTRMHEGLYTPLFDFMNTSGRTPQITYRVAPDSFEVIRRLDVNDRVAIDDDLEHAYADQYVVGVERAIGANASVVVQYVRRDFHDIWALTDTGSRYGPVQRRDPGPNGIPDDDDDGELITVSNLLNPNETFTMLTNPDDAWRRSQAVQIIGQKRFSQHWQLLGAYTWSRTRGNVNAGAGENRAVGSDTGQDGVFFNPNRRINADGPVSPDYTHAVQLQAVYVWPVWGGMAVSANYHALSGGAAGRTATITDLRQGSQTVRIEPRGTRRIDAASALDLRVEKTVQLGQPGRSIGFYVDLLNVTNEGVPFGLTIEELSGDTLGQPLTWAAPRAVRIAARLQF